uniref:excinuclease ABC subunit UvrA n=1 Tax=Candidatus Limisoma sp. TaxID=3076476 RepID=UPI003FF00FEB
MDKIKKNDETDCVAVYGARVHNLKNIDAFIPHDKLTVITGLSGSGKSSLAFDTVYAEGQRRYIETFSSYSRNMLGALERPDVDKITGLCPVISIEQKTVNKNPRSTIGTITEVYDFLRLLFARIGEAVSYKSGKPMIKYTEEQILELILGKFDNQKVLILSPLVNNRKGHYKELFEQLRRKGYLNVRVDGELQEIVVGMRLDRYKNHNIELVVDKLKVSGKDSQRLKETIAVAMKQGDGVIQVFDVEKGEGFFYSKSLMDPITGLSYREPAPHNFSFNSMQGACPKCKGLGSVNLIDVDKIIPDKSKTIYSGGILPLGSYSNNFIFSQIAGICEKEGYSLKTPIKDLSEKALDEILNGTDEALVNPAGIGRGYQPTYDGIVKYIEMQQNDEVSSKAQKWAGQFYTPTVCPVCHGARLNREALHYFIDGKNIDELANMELSDLKEWVDTVEQKLGKQQQVVAKEILKEIRSRLHFLNDVGLDYLSLSRSSMSLSGGESQRIRLATQIGSQLVNVLYILDEPSIGLHQRDNDRLIHSLKELRDLGNTVVVVEHDKDMMLESDYVIDIGPKAGRKGGKVVFAGTPEEMLKSGTLTAGYLNGSLKIKVPAKRRKGNGKKLTLKGCSGNNLKDVDLTLPLGALICVTGVSGSGKSTIINETLQPILSQKFYRSLKEPLPYKAIKGIENIDKVVTVDQAPIGKSPRSNPATYTNVFANIRNLFVELPEAKIRGYKPGRFSFNMSGGRCDVCKGNGYRSIEMNFLPNVLVPCEACHGQRYNRETLEVRFKGKSIADVLDMTINQAVEFFENMPSILSKIKVLQDVGLGYIKLGQPSSTLSGGESQRVKLATELSKKDTGKTLFILDEPTTGLHFEDIRILMGVLNKLVDRGNTVLVIEHNLDVIKCADYIVDMGPEGGKNGGKIIAVGTPEEICESKDSITGKFLRKELMNL